MTHAKPYQYALGLLMAVSVAIAGCDSAGGDPTSQNLNGSPEIGGPSLTGLGPVSNAVTLNGYRVTFLGATSVDGGRRTEFAYEVTGVEPAPPALDWFFLENACSSGPVALKPSNAVGETEADGIHGIKWNASLSPGTTRTYSYTFEGALEVRIARAIIQRGGVREVATVPGPCGGHSLSGSIFVNTDSSPAQSGSELGLRNVVVEVYQGSVLVSSDVADSSGGFEFFLPAGTYTVRVPTEATGAFNTTLYSSYDYTGGTAPAERPVVLNADVSDQDFGFNPDRQKIIADLSDGGAYQTRAQDVKFWQGVIRNAARGRSTKDPYGRDDISPEDVKRYLAAIFSGDSNVEGGSEEYYLLENPFVLTGSDLFAAGADLLSRPTKTDVEKVSRNLFAMELNFQRGWGTKDPVYDNGLMSYLEGWVSSGGAVSASSTYVTALAIGGGGGTVEESMTLAYLGGGGGGTVED